MSRAIWEGSISFGLVQIPVGLYGAESRDELDFDLLDRRDMAPVGYQRVNKVTGEVVEWGDIVKGYEFSDGEYVTVEKEDFARANVKASRTVDIVHFADAGELDILYYEKPYYLVPDERGTKPYVLLREALRRQNKIGIARVVIRTREHLAAVVVRGEAMVLELLRWHDELVPVSALELPPEGSKGVSAPELKMAERLIDEMTAAFEPEEYHDTYREDLMRLIERKAREGDKVYAEPIPTPAEASNVVDIMALLRRSLGRKEGGGADRSTGKVAKSTGRPKASKSASKTRKSSAKSTKTAARSTSRKPASARTGKRAGSKRTAARRAS